MTADVYSKLLGEDVADNGTIVFPYADGKDADDYSTVGHELYATALQANFPIASSGIEVSFGETEITVTYKGSTTIPAISKVSLTAVLLEAQEEFGDFTVNDLVVGGNLTSPAYLTDTDVGAVAGGTVVAEEHGDGFWHYTKLTLTDFVANDAEPDNADLAIGELMYTFPAGAIMVEDTSMVVTVTKEGEATIADGEIGMGTTQGATAVDTLGEVAATAEDLHGPIVVTTGEFDGAAVWAGVTTASGPKYIAAAGAHTAYLNIAATWPDVEPAGEILVNGVVTIKWRKIN